MRRIISYCMVLAVSGAAGCGGAADPQPTGTAGNIAGGNLPTSVAPKNEMSGTRLKRVWLSGSDNSVTPAGYYDTALKTRCSFQPVAGAGMLCVPEDVYTLSDDDWANLYKSNNRALFTDPTCKTADVAQLNSSACAKYGVVRVMPDATSSYYQACGGQQAPTYYVATPVSPGTALYYYGVPAGGGTCCSCQPYKQTESSSYLALVKMEQLTSSNADKTQLVKAELSVDP